MTKPLSTKRSFETPAVRRARETLFVEAAHLAGMTAAPVRIAILGLLAQGERNVEAIADAVGQSLANTSQHLRKLALARLVVVRKRGVQRAYALATPEVHLFLGALQALTAALSPVARTEEDALVPEALRSPLTLAAVLPEVRAGKAILLDVWTLLGSVMAAAALGMALGTQAAKRVPAERLKPAFGVFILVMAAAILAKELLL